MTFLIVIGLLLISAYGSAVAKTKGWKCGFGCLTALFALTALFLFLHLQQTSGGVDHGMVFSQRILPVCGCVLVFLWGVWVCTRTMKTGTLENNS